MTSIQSATPLRAVSNGARGQTSLRDEGSSGESSANPPQVAHTLTACARCRQRKTRCDPNLPRCGPCERTNSICQYWDSGKGHYVNRSYVVYLQHKVRELEEELERAEHEDAGESPETMMRAASVRMHDAKESKYLGASSGIAITRLVMQLAKQFTDAKSIMEIVPEQRARQIKDLYHQEQAKPTSKIYPLVSNVAADELPNKPLADLLLKLYMLKVQPMYPALHEPTLTSDIETVYNHPLTASPYQHFVCRMVLAISLQKMDTQYAGLADSYYLAALKYMDAVVGPMDLRTLQCFALMAEYSLLTPTRTAIYYVVGIAVRLLQALGYHEEKTITRGLAEGKASELEIDMRRRVFWCILVMELGLAHSLGRPSMLATSHEHIDVGWFASCDDKYITSEGIDPAAPRPTLKKWIAIHFFKMRNLQVEIRRKLYLRKRPSPTDDGDPWFKHMHAKLCAWRDDAPDSDEGIGLNKVWFVGRYNTMIVFLYRPSPQVPRPSLDAALKCFDACEYNIYMQREQITARNVDLTWIFTQSIFMSINTLLWSLSYVEVRRKHSKAAVEKHLEIAMDAIQLASERWPGVATAVQLYTNLINAILKIYDKDCDIPISATTPSDVASPATLPDAFTRSRTTSPATVSSTSVATPDDRPPFGYLQHQARRSVEQPPPVPYQSDTGSVTGQPLPSPPAHVSPPAASFPPQQQQQPSSNTMYAPQPVHQQSSTMHPSQFDPHSYANPLPQWRQQRLTNPIWSGAAQQYPQMSQMYDTNNTSPYTFDPNTNYFQGAQPPQQADDQWLNFDMGMDVGMGTGLTHDQQQELMQSLETDGMEDIQTMITQTLSSIAPKRA